jgi:hypothetical protein
LSHVIAERGFDRINFGNIDKKYKFIYIKQAYQHQKSEPEEGDINGVGIGAPRKRDCTRG